jgi:hypothetical protein
MAIHDDQWFEVWWEEGVDVVPSRLLIVTPDLRDKRVLVIDPYDGGRTVYEAKDYEDAANWLREDEYSMVRGREFPDDGW